MADSSLSRKKLEGKVAIVTGGASGIGEATVRHFIEHGARAVVIADVQDELGQTLVESIGHDRSTYIHCDVAKEDQVKSMVDSAVSLYGRIDILFSNAGTASKTDQTILDLDFSAYDKTLAVNARGMAACVKHAARAMVEGNVRGSIICTASLAATMGTDKFTGYTMSKHAVLGLMRSASIQLGGHGIRVNSVSPGAVGTPLFSTMLNIESKEEIDEMVGSCSVLDGVLKGKNIADAVVFLASDEAQFITGHNLVVDGGFRAP